VVHKNAGVFSTIDHPVFTQTQWTASVKSFDAVVDREWKLNGELTNRFSSQLPLAVPLSI
jgi:hypothetical protein